MSEFIQCFPNKPHMFSGGNYSLAFWISTILLGVASVIHTVAYIAKRRLLPARR
jgi:hypothetical protein